MAIATLQELIEAGVHYGCQSSRWNPKMKPYIHSRQNKVHIIDLRETLKGLIRAHYFINQVVAQGKQILFVGTKRLAQDIIRQEATRVECHFVASRWLGGTLTNMDTMRKRIKRLEELEGLQDSEAIQNFSKKMISNLHREHKKISRNFEGIREMKELPGALVIIDPRNENIAVAEAVKLGIPTIAICDTDCDPEPIDFVIPGNDDSIRSIQVLLSKLADAVLTGSKKSAKSAVLAGGSREVAPEPENVIGIEDKDVPEDLSSHGSFSYGGNRED